MTENFSLRRVRQLALSFVLVLLVLAGLNTHAAESEHFNLITIVTDDQAQWALGCYGNRDVRTPNMDRLAREGARFLNAFACTPVCSPSRAAFFTGRYGTQLGITDYIAPNENAAGVGLPTNIVTWPKVLQQHGYVTALVGKWHLGSKPQHHPTRQGFDSFFGFQGGEGSISPLDPTLEANGEKKKFLGAAADLFTDASMKFIETNRTRPFALVLNFREPHAPYAPVLPEDSTPFQYSYPTIPKVAGLDTIQIRHLTRQYYASIHSVDRNLGRLLAKLDALKLAEKTIILFTSDHGYMIGQHGLLHKGNATWAIGGISGPRRPNMFEESIRVPLLIRWPGNVRQGTEIPEMVSNIDTFATVLGMLGIAPPATWKQEGNDFSPLLLGSKLAARDAVFGQYDLHNYGLAYLRMIRTERWKLVRHYRANYLDELYDLKEDPGETWNLFTSLSSQKIRDELQERLTAWQHSIDDPILRDNVK
jgi:uncharacterized sulfatase